MNNNKYFTVILLLAVLIQWAAAFQGVFTNREFGSNSRLYMCEVTCDTAATGKKCYEGAYTRSKTSGDTADQALVGLVLAEAVNEGTLKGIWVEAGGLWGALELNQYTNKSFSGFWVHEDGSDGRALKYTWYDDLVSESVTAEQCYAFVGSPRPSGPFQGRLVSTDTTDGINHVVCPGASADDATAGSVWVGVGASSAYNGTQHGRVFGKNGGSIWAGSFTDRVAGKHTFEDENGGSSIYKVIAPGVVAGAVWVEPNGLYTSTGIDTFTLYGEETYDYFQETKTYSDCYPEDSNQYFWTGTFEDPYGGHQYLCPQAQGYIVGAYSLGYTNMNNVASSDILVGKNPRMIGYVVGTPSEDDTTFSGTWYEPDAALNLTTGVFEWVKLNSTHRQSKWWYGTDKTKAPEETVITQRLSLGASESTCRVIPPNKAMKGTFENGFNICIDKDNHVTATYDEGRGRFEGVAYLEGALLIGTYTQGSRNGVATIAKYKLLEDSIDGVLWNTRSGDYSDSTFDDRVHDVQVSENSSECNDVNASSSTSPDVSTSASARIVLSFFVLAIAFIAAAL